MALTYRNGVSIGELIVYIPLLAIAIYLAIKHGFRRNSGWLYLIIFCLARIIGPCMQLATISSPSNTSLYIGSAILNSVGVSPLELASLGLLSRLLDSIHKSYNTFLHPRILQLVQLVIVVGLILGIVGGIQAGDKFKKPSLTEGQYHPGTLSKAGTILLIISYVAIAIFTALTSLFVKHAEAGEKRLFVAVALALPFLLVRIVYSGLNTFSRSGKFNILTGDTTIFLCVALLEELVVVVIYEATGLGLSKQIRAEGTQVRQVGSSNSADPMQPKGHRVSEGRGQSSAGQENIVLRIAKKTIIGRIVMSVAGSRESGDRDVEMQRPRY